ncbi:MAG TPA: ATP-binding protein [Kouleothrix sp.]|uniref:ATP-binding protein n=1 Tax=Kouleothrix sp. TaxID=2779161 RepID=UPI002C678C73|nr:ATP-binding protein [Kouleothrix sp.]HRC75886.1 ATP-binding protein [Kouleothrix sp.]
MSDTSINQPRLEEYTQSLREESFVTLLYSMGVFGLVLLSTGLINVESMRMGAQIGGVLVLTYWLANMLRKRKRYRLAVVLFLAGALAAIIVTFGFYPLASNPFIFFTPLVVCIAGVLLRPRAGFVAATAAIAAMILAAISYGQSSQMWQLPFLAAVLLGYLSAAVAMLASLSFFTVVEWAIDSYHKVERREAQLYESEKQLQRALREQDSLNHRLQESNKQLENARAVAEYANRMKSQFVANMSHELRTPLNAIIGFSYILKQELKGPLAPDQHDYVGRIYDAGNYLLKLLNDILDNAKIEAGRLDLQREPSQLEPIVHEVLVTASSLTHGKPLALRTELASDLPLVYADRMRVAQVLLNLLSNAVKFTEHGSITLRVYPAFHTPPADTPQGEQPPDSGYVVVEVEDTGIGIAAENLELIFEEFRQADETLSRRYGGTGLGLPISRRLVELHGGRLTVASTLGRGSTFRFTLPAVADAHLRQARELLNTPLQLEHRALASEPQPALSR